MGRSWRCTFIRHIIWRQKTGRSTTGVWVTLLGTWCLNRSRYAIRGNCSGWTQGINNYLFSYFLFDCFLIFTSIKLFFNFQGKVIMHDPFAMRPFFGYNFGSYIQHWLCMKEKENAIMPLIFHVNWFRKGKDVIFISFYLLFFFLALQINLINFIFFRLNLTIFFSQLGQVFMARIWWKYSSIGLGLKTSGMWKRYSTSDTNRMGSQRRRHQHEWFEGKTRHAWVVVCTIRFLEERGIIIN